MPFFSSSLSFCRSGKRYANDFPEPVSEARRNCFHSLLDRSKFDSSISHLMLNAWMGVGLASSPSILDNAGRKLERSGGDEKMVGGTGVDLGIAEFSFFPNADEKLTGEVG